MAKRTEMPGFIKPQLATLKARAPKGDHWLHEIKFDGYLAQAHINAGKKSIRITASTGPSVSHKSLAPSIFLVRLSSTGMWLSFTKVEPISPNCKLSSRLAGRTG